MSIEPGKRVGDYEVLRELGAGGMGKVYQVRNVISDRVEAMKVLLPNLEADRELGDRFLREIKVQGALDHPNIASLRTAMSHENQLLMIMEFVEGKTVEAYIANGPMPSADAVWVITQVLQALDYAHARNIVHRDIKPPNIMITPQGTAKLMDFGIARVMSDPSITQANQTTGSIYYMSPEQINGVPLDGRSDLYSLGVTLYEMLTGRPPFDGNNTFAIMAAHLQQQPRPPMEVDSRIPAGLSAVIVRALGKEPWRRFQSAAEFAQALQQAMAQPAAPAMMATRPPSKTPRTFYMLAGSMATIGVLIAMATQAPRFFRTNAQAPPAVRQEKPVTPPVADAVPVPAPAQNVLVPTPAAAQPLAPPVAPPQQAPTMPVPQPQAQAAPVAPPVDRAAIDEQRKRLIYMAQSLAAVKSAYQSLQQSMAGQGLRPRADLGASLQRVAFEMDEAEAALKQNDPATARQHLDGAQLNLGKLEKFFNL